MKASDPLEIWTISTPEGSASVASNKNQKDYTLKDIPNTLSFKADENGNIYNPDGTARVFYRNADGYLTCSVKTTDGKWVTFGVQRLVALAYLKPLEGQTEVNHRDGVLSNNKAVNLEWVTAQQNNVHSEIMRKDNQYVCVISLKDGKPCGRYLNAHSVPGYSALEVWDSIKENKAVRELTFQHLPWNTPIPKELRLKSTSGSTPKGIKIRNVNTGTIMYFDSLTKAAKKFNTTTGGIHNAIQMGKRVRLLKKKYQVTYVGQKFIVLSHDEIKKAQRHGPRPVTGYQKEKKLLLTCESAKEFIEKTGLSRKSVTSSLCMEVMRDINGWVVVYRDSENLKKLKALVGSPVLTDNKP